MKNQPSDLFVEAVLRGYHTEIASGNLCPSASAIWDHVCMDAIQERGLFGRLFAWDSRKGHQNRIGTISEVIKAGYVPGLTIGKDARGREIVREGTKA